ncbi:hypothetical protein WN944_019185 [Citrus x changshan-huyou]|uniref:Uncharacterized protein n=1 Tax=Citrus x changshan-huyou TaxID=2935761 RepID=A0AAP0LVQ8_9ROSI
MFLYLIRSMMLNIAGCFMIQNLLNQQIIVVHRLYTVALMISYLNYGDDERFNNLLASAHLLQLWELHKIFSTMLCNYRSAFNTLIWE